MCYAHPGVFEQVLASRNVQPAELPEIAQAWGGITGVLLQGPRLFKKGVQKLAAPELFQDYPVALRPLWSWKDPNTLHY